MGATSSPEVPNARKGSGADRDLDAGQGAGQDGGVDPGDGVDEPSGVRPRVLIIGPVPPPAFGVAEATALMLRSPTLRKQVDIIHLDTSDVAGFAGIGRFTWGNVGLALRHILELTHLLRTTRPDVVLLTASQGLLGLLRDGLFVSTARMFRTRVVAYLRGSKYADMRREQGWLAAAVLRSIVKHASLVLVLGESLVGMAQSVYRGCRVAAVPNGCPPAVPVEQVGCRREDRPLVLYVGRLSRDKGLEDTLAAAGTIVASVPNVEFVMCGDWDSPEYEAATRSLVEKYGLAAVVDFPGVVSADARAGLLTRAWVVVVPSHSEGQPWVILEAMSAGVPVVATDTGAVAETVGDGQGGRVIPVGDTQALAQAVISLLQDDRLWKNVSQQAVRRYRERFTVERSHTLLAEELCQAAGKGDGSAVAWFSDYATQFDLQYSRTTLFTDRYRLWTRLIQESCAPESRVLDAGCGSGVFTAVAAQCGAQVVAADPSREMLAMCDRRCATLGLTSCTFVQKPIEQLRPAELGTFDLVLVLSVLEYVQDLLRCLKILGRLARPGATLAISIPNSKAPRRRLEKVTYRLFRHPHYYGLVKNLLPMGEFQALLEGAGFTTREVHYYGVNWWLRPVADRAWVRSHFGTMVGLVLTKL